MAGPRDQYLREMHERFGYLATWIPTIRIQLGDVGVIRGHEYSRVTTLKEENIDFDTRSDKNTSDLQYFSSDSVSIQLEGKSSLAGAIAILGEAATGITIEFQRANAVLFQASGCHSSAILNQDKLARQILERHEKDGWPSEYFIITEIVKAESATIFISSGEGGRVELIAQGNMVIDQFKLADLNAGLKVARSVNIGTTVVAQAGLTPLFKARGIKRRFLRKPVFRYRGEANPMIPSPAQPNDSGITFEELSLEDVLSIGGQPGR